VIVIMIGNVDVIATVIVAALGERERYRGRGRSRVIDHAHGVVPVPERGHDHGSDHIPDHDHDPDHGERTD
jgi:hypothetical protein